MNKGQLSLSILCTLLSVSFAFSQGFNWEINQGRSPFIPDGDAPTIPIIIGMVHGGSGGFQYASIPGEVDPGWMPAPTDIAGNLNFSEPSAVSGFMTELDFTYFQTTVTITNSNEPFNLTYNTVDDGVIAYVFNAQYPDGIQDPNGGVRLYFTPFTSDLSPLLVEGENRIVLVQFDDSWTDNYLNVSVEQGGEFQCPDYQIADLGTNASCPESTDATYLLEVSCPSCDAADFLYSLDDGESFQADPFFEGLAPGSYLVVVRNTAFPDCDVRGGMILDFEEDTQVPQVFARLEDGTEILFADAIQERYECSNEPPQDIFVVDNCDPNPILEPSVNISPNEDGSETVTLEYIVTDASGNTNTEVYAYIASEEDTQAPQIFGRLADGTAVLFSEVIEEGYNCGNQPPQNIFVVDNCDTNPTFSPSVTFRPNDDGTQTIILNYLISDASGNENRETYTYISSEDFEAPQVIAILADGSEALLADIIQESYACGEQPFEEVYVLDNCDENPMLEPSVTSSPNVDGTETVTLEYIVTDARGNTNTEVYTYFNTNDTEAPQIIAILADGSEALLADILQESYSCGEEPFEDLRIVDNCDENPVLEPSVSISPNADGTETITLDYTVRDANGNENQEVYTYISSGEDIEAPQIIAILANGSEAVLADIIQESYSCDEQPFQDIRITDNCDDNPELEPAVSITLNADGSETVTLDYLVRDANGNERRDIYTYLNLPDSEPPNLICPEGELRIQLEEDEVFVPTLENLGVSATDNCGAVTFSDIFPNQVTQAGVIFINITATDATGNNTTCSFPVRIEGDELPCEIEITRIDLTSGICPDETGNAQIIATGAEVLEYSLTGEEDYTTNNQFPELPSGTYTVFVRDAGNFDCVVTRDFTIIEPIDNEFPELMCPQDAPTVTLDENGVFIPTVENLGLSATDNCGEVFFSEFLPAEVTETGLIFITITVIDGSSNPVTCAFPVNVTEGLDDDDNGDNRYNISGNRTFSMSLNPNPVQTQTTIQVELEKRSDIAVILRSLDGNVVRIIEHSSVKAGENNFELDLSSFSSGVYFVSIRTADAYKTTRVVVSRE